MSTDRALVRRPALVSAILAPVFFIGGTVVAGLLWPEYDPVRQTISELAAGDAPTRVFMTVMFVLTGVCHVTTASFATGIGRAGRVTLFIAGLSTLAVAAFPLPTVAGTSVEHRVSAIVGFTLLALWPALGVRRGRDLPWVVRPVGGIVGTLILGALCLWFLVVWADSSVTNGGLIERFAANAESLWPAIVVLSLAAAQRAGERVPRVEA